MKKRTKKEIENRLIDEIKLEAKKISGKERSEP